MLYNKYGLIINKDNEPESPRQWNPLTKMYCAHKKYALGDEGVVLEDFVSAILDELPTDFRFLKWIREGTTILYDDFVEEWYEFWGTYHGY